MGVQIDDYSMVRFLPFDRTDEEGINIVLQHIDFSIQYGEDLEFKEPKVNLTIWCTVIAMHFTIIIVLFICCHSHPFLFYRRLMKSLVTKIMMSFFKTKWTAEE